MRFAQVTHDCLVPLRSFLYLNFQHEFKTYIVSFKIQRLSVHQGFEKQMHPLLHQPSHHECHSR